MEANILFYAMLEAQKEKRVRIWKWHFGRSVWTLKSRNERKTWLAYHVSIEKSIRLETLHILKTNQYNSGMYKGMKNDNLTLSLSWIKLIKKKFVASKTHQKYKTINKCN